MILFFAALFFYWTSNAVLNIKLEMQLAGQGSSETRPTSVIMSESSIEECFKPLDEWMKQHEPSPDSNKTRLLEYEETNALDNINTPSLLSPECECAAGGCSSNSCSQKPKRCSSYEKLCLCQVSQHTTCESCWLVAYGNVYDVTEALATHPAGFKSILRHAGGYDCTEDFEFHSSNAQKIWKSYKIGKLEPCGEDGSRTSSCSIM